MLFCYYAFSGEFHCNTAFAPGQDEKAYPGVYLIDIQSK